MMTPKLSALLPLAASLLLFSSPIFANVGEICGFAPLCGSDTTLFQYTTGDFPLGGEVLGGAELTFTDCCSLSDTTPTEDCQIVDPSGEHIRIAQAAHPICGDNKELCDETQCGRYYFAIKPFFERSSQTDCCASCTCYGDPVCNSFDGTTKTWILCDGREIPNEESIFDLCRITERRCSKEKDHAGNQCTYLASDPQGRDWSVGRKGSPCIPNPDSPPSTILMYSVPAAKFKLTVQHGERGIINHIFLELACGTFDISAESCLTNGKDAWDHSTTTLPEFFSYEDVVRGKDAVWNIIDADSGIAVNLRCHANTFDNDDGIYVARINVEDVSDPIPNRRNTDGFCVTNNINTGLATTAHTEKIIAGDYCAEGLQDSAERDIYRAICKNPALPTSGIQSCQYHFCSENFAPLYSSVSECEETIQNGLAEGFCKGVVYVESDVEKCVNQWFTLGAIETVNQYYADISGCTTEFQTSLEKCQSGVTIQYLQGGNWIDQIAIPHDFCGHDDANGEIRLSYCDYPKIFNRVIRVVQKTASIACSPVNQCTRVDGFIGFIGLVQDTPYPTKFPTPNPTNYPTPFPVLQPTTANPTVYPTSYPSPFPTTESPTQYPTPFPNNYPTKFPTQSPLLPDQEFCPQPYLCESEPEHLPIEDGVFHFGSESCCAVNGCPTLDFPVQNRTYETTNFYCQGSDSYTGEACKDDFELEVKIMFSKDEDTQCCKTCTCFGDPRCYSFDGVFDEFILCDGRTLPEANSDTNRCVIRKSTCEAQKDHEGHACKWGIPDKPNVVPVYSDPAQQTYYENHFEVPRYGSPCRYDPEASSVPTLLLYKVPDYELNVEHGDRGYIETVILTVTTGEYEMTAERCLAGKDWETLSGTSPDSTKSFTKMKFGQEYVWTIIDVFTHIELRIRCTGVVYDGKYTNSFINIEELAEPMIERITEEGSGFCASGEMEEKALSTYEHSENLAEDGFCESWNEDMTSIIQRDVLRIITNTPGVSHAGIDNAIKNFCQRFFSPGWTSVSKCTSAFKDAQNVYSMITWFCKATTLENEACEENIQMLSESSGYHDAFKAAYVQYIVNYNTQCTIKAKDLPATLEYDEDSCDTGVELQWFNPRIEEWLTYVAFPDTQAPCNGYTVVFKYSDDPKLFKNKLRVIQRHNFAYCSTCTYTSAVDAWFTFSE